MPIRFASEAWPRPGLAEPGSASIAGFGNTGLLSSTLQKGKDCHDQVQGASFGFVLAPETDMIFGEELGPPLFDTLIANSVLACVTLMHFYIGSAAEEGACVG